MRTLVVVAALLKAFAVSADEPLEVPPEALAEATAEAESPDWARTLERIAPAVVSIRVDGTRAFDTEWNQSTQATGFVVDAEQGLILTNRHVVMPGPVVAMAVFLNQEEVELTPVYRDPVHDFGLFRYDPDALRFMAPDALELEPGLAQVGREIRVVGNDAGEQLSILSGTLARLDREAPDYGRGRYNDFNTFYLQAGAGTSGGSSGSPVIDIEGRVLALNAGARIEAASSYFLPLDRVHRALKKIRNGEPVPRGTLQTTFVRASYAELNRLGLDADTEATVREAFPEQTGMLIVDQLIPGSPADEALKTGDILLQVDGEWLTEFVPLSAVLDDSVGGEITLTVQRGDDRHEMTLPVTDLHSITPDEYVEVGDAVVHRLSYQQARHYNLEIDGLYIASPGYLFSTAAIPRSSVVREFNGQPMSDLDDFERELERIPEGARVPVRFVSMDDPSTTQVRIVQMERRWFPAARCERDDGNGRWPCRALAEPPEPEPPAAATTRFTDQGDRRARALAPSLVLVNFDMPYVVAGVGDRHYYGTGLVVDADRGLVLVDQNTVPVPLGDVRLTFAGSVEIPGRVEFLHPLHNLALVSYDPELIGDTPVRSARLRDRVPDPGDAVWVVGLRADHRLMTRSTEVSSVEPLNLPLSRSLRFRDTNLDTIRLVNAPHDLDGVIADSAGRVLATWSSFAESSNADEMFLGIPASLIAETLAVHRDGRELRSLEVEWRQLPFASARRLGIDEEWLTRYESHSPDHRQLLSAVRTVAGTPAATALLPGDVLLAMDGELVNTFRQVEERGQHERVTLTVWRNGEAHEIELDTERLTGSGPDRVLLWSGALLHEPHRALAAQRGILRDGVYVSYFKHGSPASRFGLRAGRRIVEINGEPVTDMDGLLELIERFADEDTLRVRTRNWNNVAHVITMRLDRHYFPTYELRRENGEWQRIDY